MNLEEWIQNDMVQFIKKNEPKKIQKTSIRHEDLAIFEKVDFEKRIARALEQQRYTEAKATFTELKNAFLSIPKDHYQERVHLYRVMQRCYRKIYDYVADQYKTQRLLYRMDQKEDVFDEQVAPKDLKHNTSGAPAPNIEELMFKKNTEQIHMPSHEEGVIQKETELFPLPEQVANPDFEPQKEIHIIEHVPQKTIQSNRELLHKANASISEHAPEWSPEIRVHITAPQESSEHEEPKQEHSISQQQNETAVQPPVQENKPPVEEQEPVQRLQHIVDKLQRPVEEHIKRTNNFKHKHVKKRSMSELYMKGYHALKQKNYSQALRYFELNLQENSVDRATLLRIKQCKEAIYGKTA